MEIIDKLHKTVRKFFRTVFFCFFALFFRDLGLKLHQLCFDFDKECISDIVGKELLVSNAESSTAAMLAECPRQ